MSVLGCFGVYCAIMEYIYIFHTEIACRLKSLKERNEISENL